MNVAVRRRALPCGLDVIVHRDDACPLVTTSIEYRVGSSDERPDRTGFAHLFEHLFKSSQARLGGHHYDVLKRAGATEANASTSVDRTGYHETLPANQLALALWIESNRMGFFLPDFDAPRLATQQSVVRAERRQRYEDVAYGAERFALGLALYPGGHPLRHLTIGRHADIAAATVDDVAAFYRTWYVPANATLVIAGAVDDDACDALVDRYFDFPPSVAPPRAQLATPPLDTQRAQLTDRFAALSRIHRVWRAPAANAAEEAELEILASGWTAVGTGVLWRRLVYDAPLAQRVSAWVQSNRLGGELHVAVDLRTGTDPDQVRAIIDAELARRPDRDAQTALIARVVTRREAAAIWSLARVSNRAQEIQRYVLYTGEPDGFAAELARYQAVTVESLEAATARWLAAPFVEIETIGTGGPGAMAPASAA